MKLFVNESRTKLVIIAETDEEMKKVKEMDEDALIPELFKDAQTVSGVAFVTAEEPLTSASGVSFPPLRET